MSGQKRRWLSRDLIAGATLTAIAVPEVMGYAKIAKIPVVTGLYTLVIPVVVFAIFRFRSHLVVGGSSVVAAVLASGLGGAAIAGVLPASSSPRGKFPARLACRPETVRGSLNNGRP